MMAEQAGSEMRVRCLVHSSGATPRVVSAIYRNCPPRSRVAECLCSRMLAQIPHVFTEAGTSIQLQALSVDLSVHDV